LEIIQPLFEQGKKGSLFWVLDETITPMGSRKLKQWLNYPLMDVKEIEHRLEGVSELKEKKIEREEVRVEGVSEFKEKRLASRIWLRRSIPVRFICIQMAVYRSYMVRNLLLYVSIYSGLRFISP
jgi:DNA mismatch repair protein MutS